MSKSLPEITPKAVVLGILLSIILAGANAYLGLFAGMTVSASIPAAVISMGVLRAFRNSNILENNIVQTAASAGESLAAGVIFTIPALVLMGVWIDFDYFEVAKIAAIGGVIGVLFTVPLRRALIVEAKLKYPEGVATAAVLQAGEESRSSDSKDQS
ncbi:MAG: oligopeptide transporter, OPT family, partial [Candidatus Marinimicrobia bacterium]|nr:oligopeptide transporter, OPT family [Candidatus Neomarinimicrobiota bacterium]